MIPLLEIKNKPLRGSGLEVRAYIGAKGVLIFTRIKGVVTWVNL